MFIDVNVLLYASGGPHPLRAGSQALVAMLGAGEVDGVTSAEVLQELLHVLTRRGRAQEAVRLVRDTADMMPVLAVDVETVLDAADLLAELGGLGGLDARDAVHVAAMRRAGISEIVSADRGFDRVPGITRRSPDEFA